MNKTICITLCLSLLFSMASCKKSRKLEISHFEQTVLTDMNLEKKDISVQDLNAYYDLDYTIDNNDTSEYPYKRDHYVQVYAKSSVQNIANMYMIYTDYQVESEAKQYFEQLMTDEKNYCEKQGTEAGITAEFGKDYYIVLTHTDNINWRFEGVYIENDVILFCAVIFAASDSSSMDISWFKSIDQLHKDLGIKSALELSAEISTLIKNG